MDDTIRNCLILIPALPLAAAVIAALLGPKVLRGLSHWPVILALIGSFVCSLVLLREVAQRQSTANSGGYEEIVTLWTWANVENAYELKANPPAARGRADAAEAREDPFDTPSVRSTNECY